MAERVSGIYAIVNALNGKRYIGSSVNIRARIATHLRDLQAGTHYNGHLQRAWAKYGQDAFVFEIVEKCADQMLLVEREQAVLDSAKPHVYNTALFVAAPSRGRPFSEETRRKISAAHIGRKMSPQQRERLIALHLGTKASAETKAKMSAAHRGMKMPPMSEERKRGLSAWLKGKKLSEEHRAKIGAGVRGTKKPAHWVEAFRARNIGNTHGLGKKRSEEARAKTSVALTGRSLSDAHRAALRAGWINRRVTEVRQPFPQEARERIGASKRGKPLSDEHRAKLRAAWVLRKARVA